MNNKMKFLAATGLMALSLAAASANAADAPAAPASAAPVAAPHSAAPAPAAAAAVKAAETAAAVEKCYGVAKAGKNDCASSDGVHSCKGQGAKDANTHDWLSVPAGLCAKLAGGSDKPGA